MDMLDVILSSILVAIMVVTMCAVIFAGVTTFTLIKKTTDQDDNKKGL